MVPIHSNFIIIQYLLIFNEVINGSEFPLGEITIVISTSAIGNSPESGSPLWHVHVLLNDIRELGTLYIHKAFYTRILSLRQKLETSWWRGCLPLLLPLLFGFSSLTILSLFLEEGYWRTWQDYLAHFVHFVSTLYF